MNIFPKKCHFPTPPLIVGTINTVVFLKNTQSRFASVVLDGVLVPPRLARLT